MELELARNEHYHKDAIRLNTARNCLAYILYAKSYEKVYVPFYTCEAVMNSFHKTIYTVSTETYHIDINLEPTTLPTLKQNEAFLYTNYFGLKQECVEHLAELYGDRLIVDNSQAFFDEPVKGVDTFYSARKFFGVPDGAYLYTDKTIDSYNGLKIEQDSSYNRIDALVKRIDISPEEGFSDFQKIESSLDRENIKFMSRLTERLLESIDYEKAKLGRQENYKVLYYNLLLKNKLRFKMREDAVPLCYPFFNESVNLRQELINNRIYCPTYWPNVLQWTQPDCIEFNLAKSLIPLPIDQRYDKKDMRRMVGLIKQLSI